MAETQPASKTAAGDAAPPDPGADTKTDPWDFASAIVLATSALATTWAGYQAELWDGEQSALYTEASALRVEASKASLQAGQREGADLMAFGSWLSARAAAETELEDFYVRRFRPEFKTVFDAWAATRPRENPAAPSTPFVMPGYDAIERRHAEDLEQRAHDVFAAGQNANKVGDDFVLATVIFANSLFFGGIYQLPRGKKIRRILLVIAIVACVLGIIHIALLTPAP